MFRTPKIHAKILSMNLQFVVSIILHPHIPGALAHTLSPCLHFCGWYLVVSDFKEQQSSC